jgi:hypothetical protein
MTTWTIVAIDWSGAKGEGKHPGIWITARRAGAVVHDSGTWSRRDAIDFVLGQPSPVVAGLDFSFGVPAWFARELGCDTIDEVWARVESERDAWLAPTPPFWNTRCELAEAQRFRACEERLRHAKHRPKSIFQLVGNGQVGRGSVRGMPHLARLRAAGFAIWPFDSASERLVVEIYPSLLRKQFPHLDPGGAPTNDARDARVSARAMTARAEELTQLVAADDPITRIEGDMWVPAAISP